MCVCWLLPPMSYSDTCVNLIVLCAVMLVVRYWYKLCV